MRLTLLLVLFGCGDDNKIGAVEDLSVRADLSMAADLAMTLPEDMTSPPPPDLRGADFSGGDLSYVDLATFVDMTPGPKYNLTLTLNGFDLHATQLFTLYVKELPGDTLAGMGTIPSLANLATQSITINSVVEAGKSYNLDFWVDYDNSGTCNPPPTDHAWRLPTGIITGNYFTSKLHDTTWTDVCL